MQTVKKPIKLHICTCQKVHFLSCSRINNYLQHRTVSIQSDEYLNCVQTVGFYIWNGASLVILVDPKWQFFACIVNPCPAEPGCTLPLQTVQIQISSLLKKPTDLDLHCLPLSIWIYINNLDQVIWLAENWKWMWHLNLFSMTRLKLWNYFLLVSVTVLIHFHYVKSKTSLHCSRQNAFFLQTKY